MLLAFAKKNKIPWVIAGIIVVILVLLLSQVFSGKLVLAQSYNLGPLTVHYYGIFIAAALLAGYLLAKKRASRYGIEPKQSDDLIFWIVIGGFVGARIYHVLSSLDYYSQNFSDIVKVWNGGLSIFGALLGGLIIILILAKRCKLQAASLLDWLAPSLLLGQIIGRFGNLVNYEAFGYPTDLPWKMFVPESFRPESLANFQYFHPLFLYEALGNALFLLYLLKIQKNSHPGSPAPADSASLEQNINGNASAGKLFFTYLLLYNVLRFFLEFLRTDSTFIGVFRLNVIASFTLIIVSVIMLLVIHKSEKPGLKLG